MILSQKRLVQILGILWLINGLLQVQPEMFTMNMVNGIMVPVVQAQPAPIAANLNWIVAVTTQNLTLINLLIAFVQIGIGVCLLVGSRRYPASSLVKGAVIASVVWALVVWYAGEGMSLLLTGQASILTGAPGAVLLYPLLGLVVYPHWAATSQNQARGKEPAGILSRQQLRWGLGAFWLFAALLQLQPYWWQPEQISQAIGSMSGQGGLDGLFVDPVLNWLSNLTGPSETPLNLVLILLFLGLGIGLLLVKNEQVRPLLVLSMVVSFVLWWGAEAFGMILTGMATDFNSGLLLIIMALACWPHLSRAQGERQAQVARVLRRDVQLRRPHNPVPCIVISRVPCIQSTYAK
ncbi:MAG TPA: hypothetical protein VJ761_17180 [Ktedonobacteraceae bacterium]|nr:hypothetical protein [Ktedonobacteraceae bacterium]